MIGLGELILLAIPCMGVAALIAGALYLVALRPSCPSCRRAIPRGSQRCPVCQPG